MALAPPQYRYIGKSVPRREGVGKVTGAARYVDDLVVAGAIHGKTIRSTISCGRIKSIEFAPGVPWEEFTIVDHRDVDHNIVALIVNDQPVLCENIVRHREEPILLLAHPDKGLLEKAARLVRIEYAPEVGIYDIGPGAIQKEYLLTEGDVDAEFAASDVIFEQTYRTGAQEHVYIEPNGFIAEWKDGKVVLHGSLQCPYYVHKAVKSALKLHDDGDVDVIQETTGGGFGGKEEFPSVVAIHAALLSRKAGRPVRMIYDRHEDMAASTKRHPSISRVKTGCMRDGTLRALEFEFQIDGGAYVTLSPVVLSRGIVHCFGPYKWPGARLHGKSHFTNSPPYGAFRGFGAPQSLFAIEAHLNALADKLGMCPLALRRKNFIHAGDMMPTGQILDQEPNLDAMLDRALELSGYEEKRKLCTPGSNRGIGVSTVLHGTGFTGSGEVYLDSRVKLALLADGKVEVRVASTEIGQGTETIFCQIAAEELNMEMQDINFRRPQTSIVPNSGPTVASRTCSIVGRLVQRSAIALREKLNGKSARDYAREHGETIIEVKYEPRPGIVWDDEKYKGSAYGAYSWMVTIADVHVDPVTAAPIVKEVVSTVDVGTIIHPVLALGQVEGAIAQAVGWATCENVVLKEGWMANSQMTNYVIPTSVDAPNIIVEFVEHPYSEGAFGAKGVGELPMDGPGPAVAAAVAMALGRSVVNLPITPEELIS
ncbi:xanthine dehydrogenase family protein molybdopterin-binding subunit [soil metagenome]